MITRDQLPPDLRRSVEQATGAMPPDAARRALALMDLTSLDDALRHAPPGEGAAKLCAAAQTPFGPVAAVCLWPVHVPAARVALQGTDIGIATVVNFPGGDDDIHTVARDVNAALGAGATEIDIVLPYKAFLAGDTVRAEEMLALCRGLCDMQGARMKVILESGVFTDAGALSAACALALRAGADFLKTSTGKVERKADLCAAALMLQAIRDGGGKGGIKISGGIATMADAAPYLALAGQMMGEGWVTKDTFRFGASGLLGNLLAALSGGGAQAAGGY